MIFKTLLLRKNEISRYSWSSQNFSFQTIPKTFKPTILTFCVNKTAFTEKRQIYFPLYILILLEYLG